MQLDTVHDVQQAYRKVVTATSFPGTIVDIASESTKVDLETDLMRPMLLLSVMLLDAEVSFAVLSSRSEDHGQLISQLTYSRAVGVSDAGLLFVTRDRWNDVSKTIESARVGTLTDPHLGATVVLEVAGISGLTDAATSRPDWTASQDGCEGGHQTFAPLRLTGPGIEDFKEIAVGLPVDWVAARETANAEYPLGVDVMLATPRGRLVSIPRTTRLEILQWAT